VLFASVDQRLGTVGPLLRRVLRRIEPGAPGVTQDVDIIDRIAATAHRPNDLVHIGGIDVFVDGDDPSEPVGSVFETRRVKNLS